MALSARLAAIVDLLQPCETLADIGTDHGQLLVAAVAGGRAHRAIGIDLHSQPLRGARRSVRRAGLEGRVELLQGDGLAALAGRVVEAVAIAGLTGPTIQAICTAGPLGGVRQLILQPVRDAHRLRAWALTAGWHLRAERIVLERGRFFTACAFAPGLGPDPAYDVPGWTPTALTRIGPHLVVQRDPVGRAWCEAHRTRTARWSTTGAEAADEAGFWAEACARWDATI